MKNRIIFGFIFLFVALVFYLFGFSNARQGVGYALDVTQGELAFNHYKRYVKIKSDLEVGCFDEAVDKLEFSIANQKTILAEYIQHHGVNEIKAYIYKRDPDLLEELKSYEIDWEKKWTENSCNQGSRLNEK